MATANETPDTDQNVVPIKPGKVTAVCRQFLTSADEVLAHRLQNEEYGKKKDWNRSERMTARVDVPLAKVVTSEEERKLQIERMEHLERQKKVREEDEKIAKQLHQEEQKRKIQDKEILLSAAKGDEEIALRLQEEEQRKLRGGGRRGPPAPDSVEFYDAQMALELQKEELLNKDRGKVKVEMEDQALARQLQEHEKQLSEMRKLEKQLRDERNQLQLELLRQSETEEQQLRQNLRRENLSGAERHQRSNQSRDTVAILGGGADGFRVSSAITLSDAHKRQLIEMQDEELARALQEHEVKKSNRGKSDITADIERHDAQLARIMHEVEQLELLKRKGGQKTTADQEIFRDTYILHPLPHVNSSSANSRNLSLSSVGTSPNPSLPPTDYARISFDNNSATNRRTSSTSMQSPTPTTTVGRGSASSETRVASGIPTPPPPPPPPGLGFPASQLTRTTSTNQQINNSQVNQRDRNPLASRSQTIESRGNPSLQNDASQKGKDCKQQ